MEWQERAALSERCHYSQVGEIQPKVLLVTEFKQCSLKGRVCGGVRQVLALPDWSEHHSFTWGENPCHRFSSFFSWCNLFLDRCLFKLTFFANSVWLCSTHLWNGHAPPAVSAAICPQDITSLYFWTLEKVIQKYLRTKINYTTRKSSKTGFI